MVAMPVSWLPLAADYTRFSRDGRGAFWGAALGYLVPNVWLYALGAILLLTRGLTDAPSVLTAIAAGGAGAAVALVALGVDETKEPFANIYSTAVSLQNVLPRVSQRLLIFAVAAVATWRVRASTSATTRASSTSSARSSCRSSACCSPNGSPGGATPRALRRAAGTARRVARRLRLYQWLSPVGPARGRVLVAHASRAGSARRLAAELRRRLRAVARPYASRPCGRSASSGISRVTSSRAAPPRIGGGPWHAARALRALGDDALVLAKCGDREAAAARLAALGLPVSLATGGETTAFSFSLRRGRRRTMASTRSASRGA